MCYEKGNESFKGEIWVELWTNLCLFYNENSTWYNYQSDYQPNRFSSNHFGVDSVISVLFIHLLKLFVSRPQWGLIN